MLLKTHFWDETVQQRYYQLSRAARSADIIVFIDETSGSVATDPSIPVVRRTVADAERAGLAVMPDAGTFWYNTDYPLYLAAAELAPYDYVLMVEYDCAIHLDIDAMVAQARLRSLDFVAAQIKTPVTRWPWTASLNGVYPPGTELAFLTCTCLISRAAWRHLFARRIRLAQAWQRGTLQAARRTLPQPPPPGVVQSWPFSEAFMATDLARYGFSLADLAEFGPTARYDWWPPHRAADLDEAADPGFFHPVLDGTRYIDSMLRNHADLEEWFQPAAPLRIALDRCSQDAVLSRLNAEFARREMFPALKRLRAAVGEAEWRRLPLGFNAMTVPHPMSCSQLGERPQWWAVDLERPAAVYRITLEPHASPMTTAAITVQMTAAGDAWQTLGHLAPGGSALDLAYDPPLPARAIRLWADTDETLRNGRFAIMVEP